MRNFFKLLLLCLLASTASFAQTYSGYIYDAGTPAYSVNFPVENGYINVANGNLHMEFQIGSAPQRGDLQVNERLVYDSHWWKIGHYSNYYWWPDNLPRDQHLAAGWRFVNGAATGTLQGGLGYLNSYPCDDNGNYTQTGAYNYTWQDPQGTPHVFDNAFNYEFSGCNSGGGYDESSDTPANDSSGLVLTATGNSVSGPTSVIIRNSSGAQVYPSIADRYGNYWSVNNNGDLVDDRGQVPVITTYDDANHKIYFDVLRQGGSRVRYTITTVQVTPYTSFQERYVNEYPNGNNAQLLNAVQSIQLPDNSQYSFEYDASYALMTKMTLPTGGVINYDWSTFEDSYKNKNRWLSNRYVGNNAVYSFLPSVVSTCGTNQTDCHEKVVVRDPSQNESVYDQRLNNGAWNTTFYKYAGSSSSGGGGTLLTTNQTDYEFGTACGYSCNNQGAKWIVSSSTTTTLNDVNVKWTKKLEYADRASGLVSSEKTYDFYSGTIPTQPTVQVVYQYSPVVPRDVILTTTQDETGADVARESRVFTTATSQTSLPTGHAAPANPYVYLDSVSQWVNTDGSSLKTSYQWNDAGDVTAVSTPYASTGSPGAWKTYGYDAATATFATTSTEPATPSNVTLTSGASFDSSVGIVTSTTDYNGQPTTYSNFDWLGRPGQVTNADQGSSTFTYNPNGVVTTTAVDGGRTRTSVQELDEFGRASRTALSNGQAGTPWYQQDVCYDANGRVSAASQTYSGTGFNQPKQCNDVSYTYDALGRPLTVTNADGTVQYGYRGRATSVMDVNGRTKITQTDALGRTTFVCEVASQSYPGDSPQDCGLDIPGTGYLTTYTYELAAHKTKIHQGLQNREFQTDSLGRTIYTSEPERGITRYAYSYSPDGLTVVRTRPQSNQLDPNVLADRVTQLDNLGRTLSVNYVTHPGSPATGSMQDFTMSGPKQFAYDQSDVPWFPGDNAKGRMTVANVMVGTSFTTSYKYSYDPMGRIAKRFTCLPVWCSSLDTRSFLRDYAHNYAGDMTAEAWNFGYSSYNSPYQFPRVGMTYNYTIAGELDQMVGGLNDGNMPLFPYHYKAVNHTAQGTQAEQYGNGLYGTRVFDPVGRLQGKWICVGTTAPGCNANDGVSRHVEGYLRFTSGDRVTRLLNTMGDNSFGYDELGRLASSTPTGSGTPQLTWAYDRYGNRLNQHDVQNIGLPHVDLWYDQGKNHIVGYNQPNTPGVIYDKAGNLMGDGAHTYWYDQEGNLRCVDGCTKGSNLYDAFDRRVLHHMAQYNDKVERYEYNEDGQISDIWCNDNQYECQSRYYANGENFAYWLAGSPDLSQQKMHFQHNDYLGTVHARTFDTGAPPGNPNVAREGTYYSLPFGDGKGYAGTDDSNAHYAELEHDQLDIYSDTDQALNRTYVAAQGSWLQPDPYDGSYDNTDPQSFNRYAYADNNPLMFSDPSGRYAFCGVSGIGSEAGAAISGVGWAVLAGCAAKTIFSLIGLFNKPHCDACMTPRPGQVWTEHRDFYIPKTNPGSVGGILNSAGLGNAGCEFGGCGFQSGSTQSNDRLGQLIYQGDIIGLLKYAIGKSSVGYTDPDDVNRRLFRTHSCGPGGGGGTLPGLDQLCAAHDACYRRGGVSAIDNFNPFTSGEAMGGCDRLLCASLDKFTPINKMENSGKNHIQQIFGCGYILKR